MKIAFTKREPCENHVSLSFIPNALPAKDLRIDGFKASDIVFSL